MAEVLDAAGKIPDVIFAVCIGALQNKRLPAGVDYEGFLDDGERIGHNSFITLFERICSLFVPPKSEPRKVAARLAANTSQRCYVQGLYYALTKHRALLVFATLPLAGSLFGAPGSGYDNIRS